MRFCKQEAEDKRLDQMKLRRWVSRLQAANWERARSAPTAALSGSHIEGPRLCRGMVTEADDGREGTMTGSIVRLVAGITALLGVACAAMAVEQGDQAPGWTATGFDGTAIEFPAVTDGRPAVVIFWATWCPYCQVLMPYLQAIHDDYAGEGVRIVAVNAKERGRGDPQAYLDGLDFPMVAVRDGDRIAEDWGVEFIPGLFVVDGSGAVAFRRAWTDLPAGQTVAELWDRQVRTALDGLLDR